MTIQKTEEGPTKKEGDDLEVVLLITVTDKDLPQTRMHHLFFFLNIE